MRLAALNVVRQRRRSGFAVMAIAFGVTALILAGGFIEWIFWAAREGAIRWGLGHIHTTPGPPQKTSPASGSALGNASPLLAELTRLPGVKTVSPRLKFSALAAHG